MWSIVTLSKCYKGSIVFPAVCNLVVKIVVLLRSVCLCLNLLHHTFTCARSPIRVK